MGNHVVSGPASGLVAALTIFALNEIAGKSRILVHGAGIEIDADQQ
ncbi:MAG: hypothetical protein AMXMBFR84_26780 [Candidatus Hydrogenedentota bacterium]